jgi:hypothetical protein
MSIAELFVRDGIWNQELERDVVLEKYLAIIEQGTALWVNA